MLRRTALVILVVLALVIEIFGASLRVPETSLHSQEELLEQTPAEDRSLGLMFAFFYAVKKFFVKAFKPVILV